MTTATLPTTSASNFDQARWNQLVNSFYKKVGFLHKQGYTDAQIAPHIVYKVDEQGRVRVSQQSNQALIDYPASIKSLNAWMTSLGLRDAQPAARVPAPVPAVKPVQLVLNLTPDMLAGLAI